MVDPETELEFLHDLLVGLMWGVGPVTGAKLADQGIFTIGQTANTPGRALERLLGHAAGQKLGALAWNRDPREIRTHTRARSAGAHSALGREPAVEPIFVPALRHLADGVASRLRAKDLAGGTVTVRVRFADMRAVTRSVILDAPISATTMLAEIAEDLVRVALADHPRERIITLLAISVSHLDRQSELQLELPLGLPPAGARAVYFRLTATFCFFSSLSPYMIRNATSAASRPTPIRTIVSGLAIPVASISRHSPPTKTSATAWKSGGVTSGA
jgi:DNA polymerase-4